MTTMKIGRACISVVAVLAVAMVLLTACGGGGGSTPPQPPATPTNLSATAGVNSVGLTWSAVSGATGYNVYRGTASGDLSTKTKVMSSTPSIAFNDSGLTNGTTYYYQVTAINANGESSGSSEVSAVPSATLPPLAPTNLSATAASGSVGLTWSAVSNATDYNVYRGTASGTLSTKTKIASGVGSAAYTDSTVTNGTTYYYEVTAVNANGESGGSNEVSATPSASPKPFIAAQVVTWSTTPPSGFPIFTVEVCTDSGCSTHITNATVKVNGTTLTYDALNEEYTASGPMPGAGAAVNLSVTIPNGLPVAAGTYTASGTQYTTFPSVTSPTSNTTWNHTVSNTVTWTAGSPTAGSQYLVGIIDDSGNFYPRTPDDNPVTVLITSTSYTLLAGSITTAGQFAVFVGIATNGIIDHSSVGISIPNAAPGSSLWIAAVSPIVFFQVN
jgi:hypothetical protein